MNAHQDKDLRKEPFQANSSSGNKPGDNFDAEDKSATNTNRGPGIFNVLALIFLINFLFHFFFGGVSSSGIQLEYGQLIRLIESGNVQRVQVDDELLHVTIKQDANLDDVESILYPQGYSTGSKDKAITTDTLFTAVRLDDPLLVERLNTNGVEFFRSASRPDSPILNFIMNWIVPVLVMYLLFTFLGRNLFQRMGQGNFMGMGKSKAKEYVLEASTGVTFDQVAGQDEAKESLAELVDFLRHPDKYKEIGAKQPKGALLVGPPGTGKTLLARALAGEAKVPFYSISGSEFIEMFVGVGASRVRDLFEQANKTTPCIIFIDEIDAIGKSRDNPLGGNDEREQTLNQLLTEMDGFSGDKGIVVLAATNRPEVLDKALLRPGRFDRRIIVEKPDLSGRIAILQVHGSQVKLDNDVNFQEIALVTSGATGADLANMINEGALLAVKDGRSTVTQRDIMEAVEVVIAGKEKKDRVMNATERCMVAYHEVGHALVSALQPKGQLVQKITIVPRTMGSLGYTMNMPEEERYLMTKDEILAQITTLLGGRAAEMVCFGTPTTGAANDLERATSLARSMVTQFGMSETVGPMSIDSNQSLYLEGGLVSRSRSLHTEDLIDSETRKILTECQQAATDLLSQNLAVLQKISQHLLDKENLSGTEFRELLGEYSC